MLLGVIIFCICVAVKAQYQPSGWRPAGPALELPTVQVSLRSNQTELRNIPASIYGPPQPIQRPSLQYGQPEMTPTPSDQYLPARTQIYLRENNAQLSNVVNQRLNQLSQQYGAPINGQLRQNQPQVCDQWNFFKQQQLPYQYVPIQSFSQAARQEEVSNQYSPTQTISTQNTQQLPQQYGTPSNDQLRQNHPQISNQQLPYQYMPTQSFNQKRQEDISKQNTQVQYGTPTQEFNNVRQQALPNQYGPQQSFKSATTFSEYSSSQGSSQGVQTEYGSPQIQTHISNLNSLSSQSQYGAPDPTPSIELPIQQFSPDVRSGRLQQNDQYTQKTFRNQNNAKKLSPSDQTNSNQDDNDDGAYRTIVLTKEEEEKINQQYGERLTTTPKPKRKRTRKIKSREPTTPKSTTSNEEETQPEPNISVATAVANGRYLLLQPNGRLQKVSYDTTQSEEEAKTNGFTTNFRYQYVEPIYTVDGTDLEQFSRK